MARLVAEPSMAQESGIADTWFEELSRVTPAKVLSAVKRIVAIAQPIRVIAFGSRARGDHHRDSDLDLAVIVD